MEEARKYRVIAFRNVPLTWSHDMVAKALTPLPGQFMVVGFQTERPPKCKMAYVQLSPDLDLDVALRKTARLTYNGVTLYGFLPQYVPKSVKSSRSFKHFKRHKSTTVEKHETLKESPYHPDKVFLAALRELVIELQFKYCRLYQMSEGMDHRLLDRLSEVICERLTSVMNGLERPTSRALSRAYRSSYPHTQDFELVVSCLHRVEDKLGRPRTELVERELLKGNYPSETSQLIHARSKYLKIITAKVEEHLNTLDVDLPGDTEDQCATIEVRQVLKYLAPYIDDITKNSSPTKMLMTTEQITATPVRMYGEPCLPKREEYEQFLSKFNVGPTITRHPNIHNCVKFTVPYKHYMALVKFNKHCIGTSYIIRSDEKRLLFIISDENTPALMSRIRSLYIEECDDDKSDYEILDSDMEAELNREF